jgi:preprotein translocase subunit SecF
MMAEDSKDSQPESNESKQGSEQKEHKQAEPKKSFSEQEHDFIENGKKFYEKNYKLLMIIPIVIFLLAVGQIAYQVAATGSFINKGISLSGGISITIPLDSDIDASAIRSSLESQFKDHDINVRHLESFGKSSGIVVESDINVNDKETYDSFIKAIGASLGKDLKQGDYNTEFFGSSLGNSFFQEAFKAMIVAFIFMSIVVFIMFRNFVPSTAIILCCFCDLMVTVAVVNVLGVRVGTAGIAGFLMLIGYSVDTDILLSSRVLKRTEGSVVDRMYGSMKTGMMLTLTAITVTVIALIFSTSEVLTQIMLIVTIGLFADLIFTWIQNAGILKWYMEKKHKV